MGLLKSKTMYILLKTKYQSYHIYESFDNEIGEKRASSPLVIKPTMK